MTQDLKCFISTIIFRHGEYETITKYCFKSADLKSAEKDVIEDFDINNNDWSEQQTELFSVREVTADEYKILNKYI